MKLKDLKQFLSLIKDDEIEVCIQIGDTIRELHLLQTNRGDLVLSNKQWMQKEAEIKLQNITTVLKLNSKYEQIRTNI